MTTSESIKKITTQKSFVTFAILFIMVLFLGIARTQYFLQPTNLVNVLLQSSINAILAIGVTFCIITGGIDLSVGSILAVSGVVVAKFAVAGNVAVGILLALVVGFFMGAINGLLVIKLKLVPFIATLAMMGIGRGIVLIISKGAPISNMPDSIRYIGRGRIVGVPVPVLLMVAMIALGFYILTYTKLGRSLYCVGGNVEATRLSGINVQKVMFSAHAWSGLMAGLAGIVMTARLNSAQPTAGDGYELDAIAASVIGGVSLAGGEGNAIGVFLVALIMGVLRNGLNLMNVSANWQRVAIGLVLILAMSLDTVGGSRKKS